MLFITLSGTLSLLSLFSESQALALNSNSSDKSFIATLSTNAQSLFNTSMAWMDYEYDDVAGYLWGVRTFPITVFSSCLSRIK